MKQTYTQQNILNFSARINAQIPNLNWMNKFDANFHLGEITNSFNRGNNSLERDSSISKNMKLFSNDKNQHRGLGNKVAKKRV